MLDLLNNELSILELRSDNEDDASDICNFDEFCTEVLQSACLGSIKLLSSSICLY